MLSEEVSLVSELPVEVRPQEEYETVREYGFFSCLSCSNTSFNY